MDRKKVVKGLECCQLTYESKPYEKCPYSNGRECGDCNINQLHYDAIVLLKKKEAKWVEDKQGEVCRLIKCSNCGLTFIVGNNIPYDEWIEDKNYCRRCGARMVKRND